MTEARRRQLATAALVVAVLAGGLIGTVDASQHVDSEELTTGHTEFADASTTMNDCFAGLAGGLMQRVTWFNGQTLFSRMDDGGGDTWIYVTEHLEADDGEFNESTGFRANQDPSQQRLYKTNNTYKFNDPNKPDKEWVVHEYFELRDRKDVHLEASKGGDGVDEEASEKDKFYVFAVQVDDAILDGTLQKEYNFAMVIDTCRFHTAGGNTTHDGETGGSQDPWGQHENRTPENETHPHGTYQIDIWSGGSPNTLPVAEVPDDRGNESAREDPKDGQP